jgi:hypothetical protein
MTPESMREPDDLRKIRIEALLKEYDWLGDDQKRYTEMHRRDATIFFTVIGSLVTVAASQQAFVARHVVYLLISAVIFLYYMLQALNLHVVMFEAKRRASIERRISAMLGEQVMAWESVIAPDYLRRPSSVSILAGQGIFGLVLAVFLVCGVKACLVIPAVAIPLDGAELILMILVGVRWFRNEALVLPYGNLPAEPEDVRS